jgi:hypothetical protein
MLGCNIGLGHIDIPPPICISCNCIEIAICSFLSPLIMFQLTQLSWRTQLSPNCLVICCLPVATPLWVKWEDETPTPKVGDLESSGTPECLEFNSRGQNDSHWGVLGGIGKVLKRRYRKWPRIDHLDICSPSYGQKKGRESNW